MNNRRLLIYTCLSLMTLMPFTSCDDSFLNVSPETDITTESFFKSPQDLEIYSNKFYGYLSAGVNDRGSDNVVASGITNDGSYKMMRGLISPQNAGQWYDYWKRMREINFLLDNSGQATGKQEDINHYVGIGRFFRGWYYYELVKQYSDVPWYDRTIQTTDVDLLYKAQDPRTLVVDNILADLDFASKNVKAQIDGKVSKTRLTKWAVLAWQARIALHEGTMRKYHEELGLTSDYKRFLELAANSAEEIITNGPYSIYKTSGTGEREKAYEALFNNKDLTSNSEMIYIRDFNKNENIMHNGKSVFNEDTALSRDLLEEYLAIDAQGEAVPFHTISGYQTMSYVDIYKKRDPRLNQTFMQPGFKMPGYTKIAYPNLNIGGYPQVKFYPTTSDQIALGSTGYTDRGIFRFAEILLIYAEAKAELGTLTQQDLDKTIKLLRDRVGMPTPNLNNWIANIDPVMEQKYPNVSGNMKGAILEIRRERRVEMACEGLRLDDLKRWKAGQLAAKTPTGLYIAALGELDINGDGIPEFYISQNGEGFGDVQATYPGAEIIQYKLSGALFSLTNGSYGNIQIKDQVNSFAFEDKYYYYPIDVRDMVVNSNLYQNPLWKQ